jgi:hypothetical protein
VFESSVKKLKKRSKTFKKNYKHQKIVLNTNFNAEKLQLIAPN